MYIYRALNEREIEKNSLDIVQTKEFYSMEDVVNEYDKQIIKNNNNDYLFISFTDNKETLDKYLNGDNNNGKVAVAKIEETTRICMNFFYANIAAICNLTFKKNKLNYLEKELLKEEEHAIYDLYDNSENNIIKIENLIYTFKDFYIYKMSSLRDIAKDIESEVWNALEEFKKFFDVIYPTIEKNELNVKSIFAALLTRYFPNIAKHLKISSNNLKGNYISYNSIEEYDNFIHYIFSSCGKKWTITESGHISGYIKGDKQYLLFRKLGDIPLVIVNSNELKFKDCNNLTQECANMIEEKMSKQN